MTRFLLELAIYDLLFVAVVAGMVWLATRKSRCLDDFKQRGK